MKTPTCPEARFVREDFASVFNWGGGCWAVLKRPRKSWIPGEPTTKGESYLPMECLFCGWGKCVSISFLQRSKRPWLLQDSFSAGTVALVTQVPGVIGNLKTLCSVKWASHQRADKGWVTGLWNQEQVMAANIVEMGVGVQNEGVQHGERASQGGWECTRQVWVAAKITQHCEWVHSSDLLP